MLICPISLCRYLLGRREQAAVGCRPDQLPSLASLEPFQFTIPATIPQTGLLLAHSSPAGGAGRHQPASQWPRATGITGNLEDELPASEPGGSRGDNTRRGTLLLLLLGGGVLVVRVVGGCFHSPSKSGSSVLVQGTNPQSDQDLGLFRTNDAKNGGKPCF